jgi:hypothetical protein
MAHFDEAVPPLEGLGTSLLVRIWNGLHDLKDAPLHRAIVATLWARHGGAVPSWPYVQHKWPRGQEYDYRVVRYCNLAASHQDPNHRPACLRLEKFPETFRCSCGAQDEPRDDAASPRLRWKKRVVGSDGELLTHIAPQVWPIVKHSASGELMYAVCKFSPTPFHPEHAPGSLICICGGYINDPHAEDRLWPAQ